MHKQLLKVASESQLREFIDDAMGMIKETHEDLYDDLEMYLYKEIYGKHFSDWLLDKATKSLVNEDGSVGAHWTLEQTTRVAKQYDITFDSFNEYDWNYVMNMIYSDYYGAIPNDVSSYVKVAKKFLEDKDGKEGKAFCYYMTMSDK